MENRAEKVAILNNILGSSFRSGEEYLYFCPKCSHHKRKLSVNLNKNKFHCWICEYRGDIFRLVSQYGTGTQKADWKALSNIPDYNLADVDENLFAQVDEEAVEVDLDLPEEFVSLVRSETREARAALNYLRSRGVTRSDIFKWKLGYARSGEYRNRIIFPSFGELGNLNYYVGRSYADDPMKYKNPPVSKNIIFNEMNVDWSEPIVLVEGVFDAMRTENAIPVLGSSLDQHSRLFQMIAKHETNVYVALDPDAERKAVKIIRAFMEYGIEVFKLDLRGERDLAEYSVEEVQEMRHEAEPFGADGYLSFMINGI